MRILLVNPWITDFKAYDEWMRPLPLYRLLETHATAHEVALIDCLAAVKKPKRCGTAAFVSEEIAKPAVFRTIPRRFKRYGMSLDAFRERLLDFGRPDIAGVTSLMTYWYPGYRLAVEEIRNLWGDVPIVLGGIYAALMPGHAASMCGVQPGGWRDFPAADGNRTYLTAAQMRHVLPLRLQEGCPFHCAYCASGAIHGHGVRRLPLAENLARLEAYVASGGSEVVFYDDALLYRFDQAFGPFLKSVIHRGYPIRIHLPNGIHARYIDPARADLMFRAGVRTVRLGFEKPGPAEKIGAGELERAVADLKAAGFCGRDIGVYLLGGLEQGLSGTRQGAELIHSLGVRIFFNQVSPVPGSELFRQKALAYPELLTEPLLHNDATWIFTHGGFDWQEVASLKEWISSLNRTIGDHRGARKEQNHGA